MQVFEWKVWKYANKISANFLVFPFISHSLTFPSPPGPPGPTHSGQHGDAHAAPHHRPFPQPNPETNHAGEQACHHPLPPLP